MKAKNYLNKIKTMDAQIDADILEIARLEALATKTTAVFGGERVQSSGSQEKMADCVVEIDEAKKRLEADIHKLLDYKDKARALVVDACDSDCCSLLHKRYFLNQSWEQIAVHLNYSYKWVSGGLHQRALAQLQKALDGKEGDQDARIS